MDMQEIWKPVVGYEALYVVSSFGRVRHVAFTRMKKLTPKQVEAIHRERSLGKTLKEIGSLIGTHYSNVSLILKGKTWRT